MVPARRHISSAREVVFEQECGKGLVLQRGVVNHDVHLAGLSFVVEVEH